MFNWSKLGQDLSEMDVRTFSRISKVICDQLLATKAEILQNVRLYFRFACEIPQGKYIIGQDKLFRCFPLCVVRSPREVGIFSAGIFTIQVASLRS